MQIFNLPTFLTIEKDAIKQLAQKLEEKFYNFSNPKTIVFTSKGTYKRFRKEIDIIKSQLSDAIVYIVRDSSYDIAVEVAKSILMEDYNLIIGIGGGKVLDTAKYASYISKKTYIAIPTILSNDGLASPIAVLKTEEGRAKSFGCKIPDGIIIDINIIQKAPDYLLMAGIGDMLSNYTALYDWKLECQYKQTSINDFAYLLSNTSLNLLIYTKETDIKSESFITQLAQSLVLSGLAMEIAGNSRPCSGSEHLFSHSLDEYYNVNIPHGIKVALGSIVSCILQQRDYEIIIQFLKTFNINVSPDKLGITKEIFIGAWMKAKSTRPDRYSILDKVKLSELYLEEVYYKIMEVLR